MKFTVDPSVEVPAQTFPGLYPVYYITADSGVLCPDCVNTNRALCADTNDPQWHVTQTEINWEASDWAWCDNCNGVISSAYSEPPLD